MHKIKSEFKEREHQIESEHSEEVLWINRETKRILTDTYKDLKSYKDIANKDKKALEYSETAKNKYLNTVKNLEECIKNHEQKILTLEEKLDMKDTEIDKLTNDIKDLQDQNSAKSQKIKELQKTKKILSEKARELKRNYIEPYEVQISE